jgi:hypothetical protein
LLEIFDFKFTGLFVDEFSFAALTLRIAMVVSLVLLFFVFVRWWVKNYLHPTVILPDHQQVGKSVSKNFFVRLF